MTPQSPHLRAAESIENAITDLTMALVELDRMPVDDEATVGWVAHALNNYLSVSEATLDLIDGSIHDHRDPDIEKWIEGLRHLGQLAHYTIGRLTRTSTSAEFPLKPGYMDLPLLMQRACDHYGPITAEKQLQVVCRPVGDVPQAWADRAVVAVVADNLLSNAVKFSSHGGEIVVQILPGPGGVVCSVLDRGPGLSAAEQTRIFQRGARGVAMPTTGERSKGFGLAIAKEFVDRMGGKLWFESEPGNGACFSFRLPYHPAGS